ncbi:hypothetical protein QT23_00180, partial [Staphylococcus aureus]
IDIVPAGLGERCSFGIPVAASDARAAFEEHPAGAGPEMHGRAPVVRMDGAPRDIDVEIVARMRPAEHPVRVVPIAADMIALQLERPDLEIIDRVGKGGIGQIYPGRRRYIGLGRDDLCRRGYRAEHRRGHQKPRNMHVHSGLHEEFR